MNKQLLFSISHGTAFKAPSFNDLYFPGQGNANLIAETSDSTEFLTRYVNNTFTAEVSIYKTDIDDLIEWAPNVAGIWQPTNIDQSKILGIEATLSTDIYDTNNTLTLSHIDAEDKGKARQLSRRPNFSADYNFIYSVEQIDITFDVSYQARSYDNANSVTKTLKAFTSFDAGLNYRLTNTLTFLAKMTNLTDKDYKTSATYPSAERGYSLALDYKF